MAAPNDDEAPKLPPNFHLRPSRNQKQRSKLGQASEPVSEPAAPVPAPVPQTREPQPSRKARLKRSGQMHEDLTAPMPEPPAKKETEY